MGSYFFVLKISSIFVNQTHSIFTMRIQHRLIFFFLFSLLLSGNVWGQTFETEKGAVIPLAGDITQIGKGEKYRNDKNQTDSEIHSDKADSIVSQHKKKGFFRRIIDYYNRSNVDRTFEKKIDWSIAPGPNYSSDVGFGIGFLLAGLYRIDRTDSVTAPSNISIYGNFTTEKFVLLRFSGDNLFSHNKHRLSYSGAFVYFPGAFYGVGYDEGKEGYVQELTTTNAIFRISYCGAIANRLYLGVSAGFDYSGTKYNDTNMRKVMEDFDADPSTLPEKGMMKRLYDLWKDGKYDPDRQDPFSNYIKETGENPNAFNANLGIFTQYDSRDISYNASKGIFFKTEFKWYPKWLGNTGRDFGRVSVTFDAYKKIWKGGILAYDLFADFTFGNPSWHMYSKLGGMERMRGYYQGRYRDKYLVETQVELRQKIYRRHGIVGWIGVGQVWGRNKFDFDHTLCSFGVGYRFEFKNRMNIRLDYGWGAYGNKTLPWDNKRSSAFLFTASEAF